MTKRDSASLIAGLLIVAASLAIPTAILVSVYRDNVDPRHETRIRHALAAMGLNQTRFTGYSFFACGNSGSGAKGFVTVNQKGQHFSGYACWGGPLSMRDNYSFRWVGGDE